MDIRKLLVRMVSGLVYCLVIAGCVFAGEYGVLALGVLLSVLACIEFSKICHDLTPRTIPTLLLDIAGCLALCCSSFTGYTLIIWIALMVFRFILELYTRSEQPLKNLAHSFMSQIYIGIPMGLMAAVGFVLNPMIILAIFILIWINDTGAFLVGCTLGRHKLFERISPKKTWEGFIGGVAFCVVASWLFGTYCNDFFGLNAIRANTMTWILFGFVVSIFGTWGDLVESLMKRSLHIKDSGNLIPGHGGILDRIDSFLLVMPAAAIFFYIVTM